MYSGRLKYICWNLFDPPLCIDELFGAKSSPELNPDSSPLVQSLVHAWTGHRTPVGNWYPRPTYIYPIAISENIRKAWFFYCALSACRSFGTKDYWTFSHCFYRMSFCSRVYMYVHRMRLTVMAKANHSWRNHFAHLKKKFSHGKRNSLMEKDKTIQNAIFL